MRIIKEIAVGDRKILIKELTLAELRAWLAKQTDGVSTDLADAIFDQSSDLLVSDIPHFSDLTPEVLNDLAPSEIEPVVKEIVEVNQRFFAVWQSRLQGLKANLQQTA